MKRKLEDILVCPICRRTLHKSQKKLSCSQKHSYEFVGGVPIMAVLDSYQEEEAKAWEDHWKKGINKNALNAYKQNMKIFKKLGFWEESGEAAGLIPSKRDFVVLDLGCGNGLSTRNIEGELVVGMDLSAVQMIRAKKKYKSTDFVVGDAESLPFKSNSFDLVVGINLLHHLPDPNKAFREIYRVLKKRGRFLSVDPNLYNPIGYMGRGLYRLLGLKKFFPTFPQFALGEDERQFSKSQYYKIFHKSPFKKFVIKPHRIERLLFFSTILIPSLYKVPYYEKLLTGVSNLGNKIVQQKPFDWICYFWIGSAYKE